jgi:hypothetical protein
MPNKPARTEGFVRVLMLICGIYPKRNLRVNSKDLTLPVSRRTLAAW